MEDKRRSCIVSISCNVVALTVLVGKTSVDVGVSDTALAEEPIAPLLERGVALITCDELSNVELGPVKEDTDASTLRNAQRTNRIKGLA
jgi:hypothetical protein